MARVKWLARPLWALFWLFLFVQVVMLVARTADDPSFRPSGREMGRPSLTPLPSLRNANLDALATLNREAAAQVALVGLAPTEDRLRAARSAASWMSQAIIGLPQTEANPTRQRKILDSWRQALNDYANGRSDGLVRIRIVSQASVALYEEMVEQLDKEITSIHARYESQLEEEE